MDKEIIDKIKNAQIFKDLNLTDYEVIKYFCELETVLNEHQKCISSNLPCQNPFHFKMIRNKNNKLELVSTECLKCLNDINYLKRKNLIYCNEQIDNNLFFNKDTISIDQKDTNIKKLLNKIQQYRKNDSYENIYVYGNKTSKTYIFKSLLNTLILDNKKCAYINVPILAKDFIIDQNKILEILNLIDDVDILLIDDLGNEKIQYMDYFMQNLILLLSYRSNKHKPTLINSNYKINDLRKNYNLQIINLKNKNQIKNQIDKFIELLIEMFSDNIFYLNKSYKI